MRRQEDSLRQEFCQTGLQFLSLNTTFLLEEGNLMYLANRQRRPSLPKNFDPTTSTFTPLLS
ncbi:MAG: hypothetical protein JRI35_00525 [Deltaproteobacteria bacterium]|nr:hypothetical protein [Deltaproteobacteria bacterium]MBW1965940.1 hypothetical protein [Deltaproteobacteria bacterium]MBW2098596.1 hypothetical protein [Deltaproteobacteria bacterium]